MKPTSIIFCAVVLFAGCTDHYLPCRPVQGLWKEKVSLEVLFAETICSPDNPTGIRFGDVTESRCPENMYCIWAGQVRVTLDIVRNEKVIGSFEMNAGEQQEFEVDQQSFIFTLGAVTPNPPPPPNKRKKAEYKIVLEVEPK